VISGGCAGSAQADEPAQGVGNPPNSARLRAYCWWLNGDVTRAAITRDLELEKRFTRTNVRKLTKHTPLMDTGLLGPLRVLAEERLVWRC
jgi:hypothetical protein